MITQHQARKLRTAIRRLTRAQLPLSEETGPLPEEMQEYRDANKALRTLIVSITEPRKPATWLQPTVKTIEQMQTAVDAVREVCKQRGVVLIGSCHAEDRYAEIEVVGAAEVTADDLWRLTNTAERVNPKTVHVLGIGDATQPPPQPTL